MTTLPLKSKKQGPTLQLLACISPTESFSCGFIIQSAGLHKISTLHTLVSFQLMPSAEQVILLVFLDCNTPSGVSEEFCSITYKPARTATTMLTRLHHDQVILTTKSSWRRMHRQFGWIWGCSLQLCQKTDVVMWRSKLFCPPPCDCSLCLSEWS